MGKVHINSEKQNRKKIKHENVLPLNPIIGPGLLQKEEQSLSSEVAEKIREVIKEVPVIQYIERPIEVIKTVEILVPSEPKIEIKEVEKIIEIPRDILTIIKEVPDDYESLKKQNKLLKILVPIFAVVAIIGLFI